MSADDANDKGEIVYTAVWQKAKDLIATKTAEYDSYTVGDAVEYPLRWRTTITLTST